MKLTLEPSDQPELEVIIRGNLDDPQAVQIIAALHSSKAVSRLFLYRNDRAYLYPVEDILYFEAQRGKILAHTAQGAMEARHKLYQLSDMLRSSGFIQINKSVLMNVREVESVEAEFSGNYTATLKSGTSQTISRKYFKAFHDYIVKEL